MILAGNQKLVIYGFIAVRYIPSIPKFMRVFFNHVRMLKFVKCFFYIHWGDHMAFVLHYIKVMYHISWFVFVEPSLHPTCVSHLSVAATKCVRKLKGMKIYLSHGFRGFSTDSLGCIVSGPVVRQTSWWRECDRPASYSPHDIQEVGGAVTRTHPQGPISSW